MYGINPCKPGSNKLDCGNYFFYCSQCDSVVKTKEVTLMVCDSLSAEPKYKVSVLRCLRHELDGFQFGDDITTLHALVHNSDRGEFLYRQLIDRYYGVRILDLSTTCLSVLGALMASAGLLLSCVFTSLVVGLPAWFVGLIIGGVGVFFLLVSLITSSISSRKVTAWRQLADEYISLCSLRKVCDDSQYHMVNHYPQYARLGFLLRLEERVKFVSIGLICLWDYLSLFQVLCCQSLIGY